MTGLLSAHLNVEDVQREMASQSDVCHIDPHVRTLRSLYHISDGRNKIRYQFIQYCIEFGICFDTGYTLEEAVHIVYTIQQWLEHRTRSYGGQRQRGFSSVVEPFGY